MDNFLLSFTCFSPQENSLKAYINIFYNFFGRWWLRNDKNSRFDAFVFTHVNYKTRHTIHKSDSDTMIPMCARTESTRSREEGEGRGRRLGGSGYVGNEF